ncbi:MAG: hypothetical protein WA749_14660 [Gelidibacter sp.]
MEIVWTKFAKITYFEILENLEVRWTFKEVKEFHDLTNAVLNKIKLNQVDFPAINVELNIKKAIIHKSISLYFKMESHSERVYLIVFFNNRMNPKTLRKLLRNQ